jgi:hypothetical protein
MNIHMEICSTLLDDFHVNGAWLQGNDGKTCTAEVVIHDSLALLEEGRAPGEVVTELRKRYFAGPNWSHPPKPCI